MRGNLRFPLIAPLAKPTRPNGRASGAALFPADGIYSQDMAMAIAVRTRLFARLREQAGTDAETVEVRPGSTVDDVYDALQKAHAGLDANRESVRVAVKQGRADWDAIGSGGHEGA